ncbi:MAG: DUF2269 family protein [Gaiellaceae bacterium]
MTWYTFLLFVHVSMAIVWLGGALMMQFFALRAIAAGPERAVAFTGDAEWVGKRVLTGASLLAVISGILLVVEGPWSFGDDWIVIGLVLFGISFLSGVTFLNPESGRLGKVIAEQGLESPEAQRRMARIILYSRIELVLLFLIVFDMTVKPEVGDTGAVLFGLGAAAAAAALIVWRSLAGASRAQAPASARTE